MFLFFFLICFWSKVRNAQLKKKFQQQEDANIQKLKDILEQQLKDCHKFFDFQRPKDFQTNTKYLQLCKYFSIFGIDIHNERLFVPTIKTQIDALKKNKYILSKDHLFKVQKRTPCCFLYDKVINIAGVFYPKNPDCFDLKLQKIVKHYPHQFLWKNKTNNTRKKCKFCNKQFDNSVQFVFWRCDWCHDFDNRCHLTDIATVGKNKDFILCPNCFQSDEWIISYNDDIIKQVDGIVRNFFKKVYNNNKKSFDRYYVCSVPNGFEYSKYIIFGFFKEQIKKRFIVLNENEYIKYIQILKPFQKKYQNHVKSSKMNVRWFEQEINLDKDIDEKSNYWNYWRHSTFLNKWKFPSKQVLWTTQIGPLEHSGFFCLPCIGKHIKGFKKIQQGLIKYLNIICVDNIAPSHHPLISKNCASTFFKYCNKKYKIIMLSLGKSYKSGKCCYDLIYHHDVDYKFDEEKGNDISVFNNFKKYGNKYSNKLEVVKSNLENVLIKEYKEFMNYLNELKALSSQILFNMGEDFKELRNICHQYIKRGFIDGKEYSNVDCMVYFPGYIVCSHVDHEDLVNLNDDPQHIKDFGPLVPGVYLVWKIKANKPQILCNNMKVNNQCINSNDITTGFGEYNHCLIQEATLYGMIKSGVLGGVTHGIHNSEEDNFYDDVLNEFESFGPFTDKSITIVLRPLT